MSADAGPTCAPTGVTRNLSGNIIDPFAAGSLLLTPGPARTAATCKCNLFTLSDILKLAEVPGASACHDRFDCDDCAIEDAAAMGYSTQVPLGPNAHIRFTTHGPEGSSAYADSFEVADVQDVVSGSVINFDPMFQWRYVVSHAIVAAAAAAAGLSNEAALLAKGFGIIQTDICGFQGNTFGLSPNITIGVAGAVTSVFNASWDVASGAVVFTRVESPGTSQRWAFPLGFYVGDGSTGTITIKADDLMDPSPPLVYGDLIFNNAPGKILYARPPPVDTGTISGGCATRFHG
jgi:hypothetical protein